MPPLEQQPNSGPSGKKRISEDGSREHAALQKTVNEPLPKDTAEKLKDIFSLPDEFFNGNRLVTEQDKALYSLCRPERLLELAWKFTLFDGGMLENRQIPAVFRHKINTAAG